MVLYDGNPLYPDWKTMFRLIEGEACQYEYVVRRVQVQACYETLFIEPINHRDYEDESRYPGQNSAILSLSAIVHFSTLFSLAFSSSLSSASKT